MKLLFSSTFITNFYFDTKSQFMIRTLISLNLLLLEFLFVFRFRSIFSEIFRDFHSIFSGTSVNNTSDSGKTSRELWELASFHRFSLKLQLWEHYGIVNDHFSRNFHQISFIHHEDGFKIKGFSQVFNRHFHEFVFLKALIWICFSFSRNFSWKLFNFLSNFLRFSPNFHRISVEASRILSSLDKL
jgi:hypothetical protein